MMQVHHAISATVVGLNSPFIFFGKPTISFDIGGEIVSISRVKTPTQINVGDRVTLVDKGNSPLLLSRSGRVNPKGEVNTTDAFIYCNFADIGIEPRHDFYMVICSGHDMREEQFDEFQCLSAMVDDWRGFIDDGELTLMRLQSRSAVHFHRDTFSELQNS